MSEQTLSPMAGWYPDPEMVGTQRYWTGSEWTEHRAPIAPQKMSREKASRGIVIAGFLFAIVVPLVGLVLGLTQVKKADAIGWKIMGVSMLGFAINVVVLSL